MKNDLISLKSNYFSFRQKFRIHFEAANQYKLGIRIYFYKHIQILFHQEAKQQQNASSAAEHWVRLNWATRKFPSFASSESLQLGAIQEFQKLKWERTFGRSLPKRRAHRENGKRIKFDRFEKSARKYILKWERKKWLRQRGIAQLHIIVSTSENFETLIPLTISNWIEHLMQFQMGIVRTLHVSSNLRLLHCRTAQID